MLKPIILPEPPEPNYGSLDPLDGRYFDAEVARYLSEQARVSYQAYMEAALGHTLAEFGLCSKSVAVEIEKATRNIDIKEVYEEEKTTKHDIKALVNCIKSQISDEAKPFVHFGATSYDIVASAQALQMRDMMEKVVIPRLKTLLNTLSIMADKYSGTVQIGRTHGQHAVPITFGFAIAEYVERLGYSLHALEWLPRALPGKFSGATGSYNALSVFVDDPLKFEETVLDKVGLKPAPYSTQIVPPEYMIRLINEMVVISGVMANLSHDMRHLQRSEIGEVCEKFEAGQTGSSTMAHKRNPWNFENVISMNKQILAQSVNANQNLSSEHQRDLTDSASARFYAIVPACIANMAARLNRIMGMLEVDEAAMQRNLAMSAGAIAAEPLYLLFEKYGHVSAHEKSKDLAHLALSKKMSLVAAIQRDPEAQAYWNKFSPDEKKIIENPEKYYSGLAAKKTKIIAKKWKQI
jgi:adenylosuccinate lyase